MLKNSSTSVALPTSQLILQPIRRFTYVTAHSPTLPLLHLRHSSFSNPCVALPTPQLILQPFRRFTYVTTHQAICIYDSLKFQTSFTVLQSFIRPYVSMIL